VSSAIGAAYIFGSLVFAGLFAILAIRTYVLRRIVLTKRSRGSGNGSGGGGGAERHANVKSEDEMVKKGSSGENVYGEEEEEDEEDENPFGPATEAESLLARKGGYGGMDNGRDKAYDDRASSSSSGRSSLPHRHRKNKTKTAVLVLVFVVVFPVLFLLSLAGPDSFSEVFTSSSSSSSLSSSSTTDDTTTTTTSSSSLSLDDHEEASSSSLSSVMKTPLPRFFVRHLDLVMFYAYIYLATLFGVLSQLSDGLRRFMLRRSKMIALFAPSFLPFSVSNAQATLFILLLGLMAAEGYYYFTVHEYARMEGSTLPVVLETAGRTAGSLCKVLLGFLVLPVVKNSVWCVAFGLNRSSLIKCHQWTGNTFLVMVMVHIGLMAGATGHANKNPLTAFPENFTVPLMLGATVLVFVSMGVLARDFVRRVAYEVFLVAHLLTYGAFIVTVLWHADGAWKVRRGKEGSERFVEKGCLVEGSWKVHRKRMIFDVSVEG
jgi:hypothetical protein